MPASISFPAAAADSCPQNRIDVSRTDVGFWSTAPTGSIEFTQSGDQIVSWDAAQRCTEGCYDLPKATLVARGFNSLYGPGVTHVSVTDDYVVLGPAGAALAFEVVLQLSATIDVEGTADAGVGAAGSPSQALQLAATGHAELELPVVVAPGTPFEVNAYAAAVGGHFDGTGLAVATLRFRGLPAGYVIASCNGYDQQTPSRPATWGALKSRYR